LGAWAIGVGGTIVDDSIAVIIDAVADFYTRYRAAFVGQAVAVIVDPIATDLVQIGDNFADTGVPSTSVAPTHSRRATSNVLGGRWARVADLQNSVDEAVAVVVFVVADFGCR